MSRLLITGANGFLGSALCQKAILVGEPVRGTDRQKSSPVTGLEYISADITNPISLKPVVKDVDIVVHAAGLAHVFGKIKSNAPNFSVVNDIGTANIARAVAESGAAHFVLISSVSVYGFFARGLIDETFSCRPLDPYAESKYRAEQRSIEIAQKYRMALTILRLVTLYGEGDPGNVSRLMRAIDRGRFIYFGNGLNRKNLLHREDAALACLAVVRRPPLGVRIYNVSAPPCTMREVVEVISRALGKRRPPISIPALIAKRISALFSIMPIIRLKDISITMKKMLADDIYDSRKFKNEFNFQTRVNLEDGLCREVAMYRRIGS